ncbi:MAG TPA: hypothetical protein VMU43_13055 [Candidatus Acidoferrum sp.]|nr:hypothetical protein [Candidatus Acidoferrum sp.]
MKIGAHFALAALVFLSVASAGLAGEDKSAAPKQPAASDKAASGNAVPSSDAKDGETSVAAAGNAAAAAKPAPSASDEVPSEAPRWNPMPASSGNPGLLTLETGETLSKGSLDVVGGVSKISRMPATVTVLQVQPAFAYGVTNWLSFSVEFNAWNHLHVDEPAELSLSPVNALNPMYKNTIYPSVLPATGFPPAYVEDFPYAASNSGDYGELNLGFKIGLLSERRGNKLSLSVSNNFYLPTKTGYSDLIYNQVQNGRFSYQIGLQASKALMHKSLVAVVNASYRILPNASYDVAGFSTPLTLQQADQVQVGAGFLMFPDKRLQVISEYEGLIFVGTATQNTTYGARDPVDSLYGVRIYPIKQLALDIGYRYNLNLTSDKDRNGFVVKITVASWREKRATAAAQEDRLVSSCVVDKNSIPVASTDIVEATANASDSAGHPLTYSWTATGGEISGSGPYARWNHAGLAAGSYTLSARVDDGAGHTSTCTTAVTLTP